MIPIKLSLRNFMPYRDNVPPLSFEGIHIACLSGDNGNGKSALLDAMTWALWGKARAKSADDLVHQGEREMEVEFHFALGEQRYRVRRWHSKPKRQGASGQTVLELQLATPEGFKSLTGNTLEETQRKIIDLLKMDYQTFTNSAFLLQGRADAFTVKDPAERKELLGKILGLGLYDELEEKAKELSRARRGEKQGLETEIASLNREIALKAQYLASMQSAQQEIPSLESQSREAETTLQSLRSKKEELEHKSQSLKEIEKRIQQREEERYFWEKKLEEHRAKIAEYEKLLEQRQEIEEGYQHFLEVKQAREEGEKKLRLLFTIREARKGAERAIDKAKAELEGERRQIKLRIQELEAQSERVTRLKEEWRQAHSQLDDLEARERELREKKEESSSLSARILSLEEACSRLQREVKELEEKLDLLSHGDARCPLCERELEATSREQIEGKFQTEREAKLQSLARSQEEMSQLKGNWKALGMQVALEEAKLKGERQEGTRRLANIERDMREGEKAAAELPGQKALLTEIVRRLEQGDYTPAEQARLREEERREAELGYNAAQDAEVRRQFEELQKYDGLKLRLEEGVKALPQEKRALSEAEEAASSQRKALEEERQKRNALSQELTALPPLLEEIKKSESALQSLLRKREGKLQELAVLQDRIQRCQDMEKEKEEKEGLWQQASKEEEIYRRLAGAFGKEGIQALLIELALPYLEAEANRLLGRMTDNRMHLKIETQRETKKGETRETLDIKVSDELGTRDYDLFSGGEAFRINFALRVALSKLLARRAGAPLPTLILDEGFGTQDASGREKLVEAISSIQEDFNKIIVVTHIEELKEAFPVRIEVIKTSAGSTLSQVS